jgi:uncharacterized protein YigE (DUF2233 family)
VKNLLLLVLFSPACLYADWKILERRDLPVSDGKLTASVLRVTDGTAEAEVNLVWFTPADVKLEVIANTVEIRSLRELIETHGGLAGINGGYFEANLNPVGLLISNDRVLHRLQRAKLLSGIFYVKSGRPGLARTQEFPGVKGIEQAIQCGPFLVDAGRVVAGLNNDRVAPRTFVFSCGSSVWGFGVCRSVTLEEMGAILAHTTMVPDHRIIRALNFDGGSSTTFYVTAGGRTIFSQGRSEVSNYLVVKRRN